MSRLPFLPLPKGAIRDNRDGLPNSRPPTVSRPTANRQGTRLTPQFQQLQKAFDDERVEIQPTAVGSEPEKVLVFEAVGSIQNLGNAAARIDGLEWMADWIAESLEPDDDFYRKDIATRPLSGRLYLVFSNNIALQQLVSLFNRYVKNPEDSFSHGLNRWKDLFKQLRSVRPWGVEDRLRETGILDYWRDRLMMEDESIPFEIELWPRRTAEARAEAFNKISRLVTNAGGSCVREFDLADIAYHGVLIEAPRSTVKSLLNDAARSVLAREDSIMFFQPCGQASIPIPELVDAAHSSITSTRYSKAENVGVLAKPNVAILDGVPLENHPALAGRLVVDDPDDWAAQYEAKHRCHGTAMASLVLHGPRNSGDPPLTRQLYVRPILQPGPPDHQGQRYEQIPPNSLPVDVIRTAVERILQQPEASDVCVVNLSVCDSSSPFDVAVSPWARLLDWLAWKYGLLFVVSTGNHADDIELNMTVGEFQAADEQEKQGSILNALLADSRLRRVLAPAESLNAITVGASHADESDYSPRPGWIDPICHASLGNAITSFGRGFKRSVKPDLVFPGGRQVFSLKNPTKTQPAVLTAVHSYLPPGHLVATPTLGQLTHGGEGFIRGTSCAAALASRRASLIDDAIQEDMGRVRVNAPAGPHRALAVKALLAHGAQWGSAEKAIRGVLPDQKADVYKRILERWVGYGVVATQRGLSCGNFLATMIGWDNIERDKSIEYRIPLPPSLSGKIGLRRLIVTLAWFSPINPRHQDYRRARLWFSPVSSSFRERGDGFDWQATRRGTLQHQIFEGQRAFVFQADESIKLQVNCTESAGRLQESIPFALAVSIELADQIGVLAYSEISNKLRVPVRAS